MFDSVSGLFHVGCSVFVKLSFRVSDSEADGFAAGGQAEHVRDDVASGLPDPEAPIMRALRFLWVCCVLRLSFSVWVNWRL